MFCGIIIIQITVSLLIHIITPQIWRPRTHAHTHFPKLSGDKCFIDKMSQIVS